MVFLLIIKWTVFKLCDYNAPFPRRIMIIHDFFHLVNHKEPWTFITHTEYNIIFRKVWNAAIKTKLTAASKKQQQFLKAAGFHDKTDWFIIKC